MTPRNAGASRAWMFTLLLAVGIVVATGYARAQRARFLSSVALEPQAADSASLSGRVGGTRELILPERGIESAHWIIQTQQMLQTGAWRVRHIDYENAPHGRTVRTPSPYRWWLGAVAWLHHFASGDSLAVSVERAALWADPVLHTLLILLSTLFAVRHFGGLAAALVPLGLATLFPLATAFQPGAPDDETLSLIAAIATLLPLAAGLHTLAGASENRNEAAPATISKRARRCFLASGVACGLGLWLNVSAAVPVMGGVVLGGVLGSWWVRRGNEHSGGGISVVPWWTWGASAATVALVGWLVDYAPDHLASWELRLNHPLYALACLGSAAFLSGFARIAPGPGRQAAVGGALLAGGVLAWMSLPVAMWLRDDPGFLARGFGSFGLSRFSTEGVASSLGAWFSRDGMSRMLVATVLPLLFVASAAWLLRRREIGGSARRVIAFALGPVVVLLAFAVFRLGSWDLLEVAILALVVVSTAALQQSMPSARGLWIAAVALIFGLGATQIIRPLSGGASRAVDESEFSTLVQRDLAHWLAKRTRGTDPVVLAPPGEALALAYYGGLRGLGTINWENGDGIRAASRVLRSTSPEEGEALFSGRGISHVILPSWDRAFDQFAGAGSGGSEGSFLDALRQLSLPPWMRPVAYQMPKDASVIDRSVLVLEVVEEQSEALELSRLAEYFVETGQLDFAAGVERTLRRFPADLGAWVARVQVEMAVAPDATKAASLPNVISMVENGGDRVLAWDRRVALAVVLARGQRMDLAREQVRRCLTAATPENLRGLSSGPLYRLLLLGKTLDLAIADESARLLALDLLPTELRTRLATARAR